MNENLHQQTEKIRSISQSLEWIYGKGGDKRLKMKDKTNVNSIGNKPNRRRKAMQRHR